MKSTRLKNYLSAVDRGIRAANETDPVNSIGRAGNFERPRRFILSEIILFDRVSYDDYWPANNAATVVAKND